MSEHNINKELEELEKKHKTEPAEEQNIEKDSIPDTEPDTADMIPESEPDTDTDSDEEDISEDKTADTKPVEKKKMKKRIIFSISVFFVLLAALTGYLAASYILIAGENHSLLDKLKNFKPKLITKVYDRNNTVIGTFSREKRELITYEEIPENFVHALTAVEDSNFFYHVGVDPIGVVRAMVRNILAGEVTQGASTLTMQLVRLITDERTTSLKRKVNEAILAIQIEQIFTKEEIFERYANQVYLGRSLYGIQAASNHYFGKDAAELTLGESAYIAGLVQIPNRFSSIKHLKAATNRRNHVLKRMLKEEYIDKDTYEEEIKKPLILASGTDNFKKKPGAHFLEDTRKYLYRVYGMDAVLDDGLNVYTTLDLDLQIEAEKAVRDGLKKLDKRQGFRIEDKKFIPLEDLETYFHPSWNKDIVEGDSVYGVVMASDDKQAEIRFNDLKIKIGAYEITWTKIKKISEVLSPGDVVLFKFHKYDPEKQSYNISLDQEPNVEGALLALDHNTGQILAMVGGYSFEKSEYNRAMNAQAIRQTGSIFKPILFGAAFDSGFTLADTFFDEPTVFLDPSLFYVDENKNVQKYELTEKYRQMIREGEFEEPEPYMPQNYYRDYDGLITLRRALEHSKNIVSVKLFNRVGARNVIRFAKKCGIENHIEPYLSSALGSTSLTLREVCKAYSTFAALGERTEPYYIMKVTDRYNKPLEINKPLKYRAISEETAYLTVTAMKGVIANGSGVKARQLNWTLCGKTGTTDDYTDAWFVGSDPEITLGVWVGFDIKKTLGDKETGARAALPIWIDTMKAHIKGSRKTDWKAPRGIIRDTVDIRTGLLANEDAGCPQDDYFLETFVKGTEPYERCQSEIHDILGLPYYMQHGKNVVVDRTTGDVKPNIEFIIHHNR